MVVTESERLRSSCDDCRARKLKCSGRLPICGRCENEGIICVYSPQKPMGRPRKRRREQGDSSAESHTSTVETCVSSTTSATIYGSGPIPGSAIVSPPDFGEFAGYPEVQGNGVNFNYDHAFVTPSDTPLAVTDAQNFHLGPPADTALWNETLNAPLQLPQWNLPIPHETPPERCACLSSMYLTLTNLQNMTIFSFPAVIYPLRQAINTALSILSCDRCPREVFSSMQNLLTLTSLLTAIVEHYHKLLQAIENEAASLEQAGQKKAFRIGDTNPNLQHLHTGTPECPMALNIDLEPKEWRKFVKRAVRSEVLGEGSNRTSLRGVVDQVEQRQHKWHEEGGHQEKAKIFGTCSVRYGDCRDLTCLRMISQIRTMIETMQWE
ncbi:hypothetical protein GQ43DRAFT_439464 [Delitschia confertaspora ATCC 74209]|uniref:Zn(2)-C6 fungal-type domain-containing protein n=1 Tax=Delitschia confertaspora ATCC 74209 TaxID=1513339 RepID=A0A9P4JNX0_9PLEO|nr:hypothetical protein GQ43DRAFT_439464 [Delitschia confertaspora ATCC 74209]